MLKRHRDILPQLTTLEGSSLRAGEGAKENDFLSKCDDFSKIVRVALSLSGVRAEIAQTYVHTFLKVDSSGADVYVDPTMGQFIGGHSHIFVGTEANLTDLVHQAYADNRLVNLSTYFRRDMVSDHKPAPVVMINRLWRVGGIISWLEHHRLDGATSLSGSIPTAG